MRVQAIFLLISLSLACSLGEAETLEVAADRWCPVNYLPENDRPGYAVELLRLIFAQEGVNYRVLPWKRAIHNAKQGSGAAVIGAGADIVEREGLQIGQEPIGYISDCLYVPASSTVQYRGNADDLNAIRRLGVGLGYVYVEGFKEWMTRPENALKVFWVSGEEPGVTNLRKLVAGSLDGMIDADVVMEYLLHMNGLTQQFVSVGCDHPEPIYVAFGPKGSQGDIWVKQFDRGIVELRRAGKLQKILDKYGLKDWK